MVKTDARFFDAMRVLRGTINGLLIVEKIQPMQAAAIPITNYSPGLHLELRRR